MLAQKQIYVSLAIEQPKLKDQVPVLNAESVRTGICRFDDVLSRQKQHQN
jgi:hypothetical protein